VSLVLGVVVLSPPPPPQAIRPNAIAKARLTCERDIFENSFIGEYFG
jgi:hypothetical protein